MAEESHTRLMMPAHPRTFAFASICPNWSKRSSERYGRMVRISSTSTPGSASGEISRFAMTVAASPSWLGTGPMTGCNQAVKEAFGAHAGRLAVSSTKSMNGHLVGAAGAVELGLTLMAVARGRIPPTANLTQPDAECDLDFVPLRGREAPDLEYALSNSFGFGGSNASLVVRRITD